MSLAAYKAAPESVRADFDRKLAADVRAASDFRRWLDESVDDDPVPPRPALPAVREVRWDERWNRRAKRHLQAVPDRRRELEALDLREEWERLTGEEVPAFGLVSCPSPDHEDSTPSCSVRDERWRCFGCGANGTVIDLASIVFGIEPYGAGFFEVRERLLAAA